MIQVICGFPGVGKSTLIRATKAAGLPLLDSDSSTFPKDQFPGNYIEHIKAETVNGNWILASSHGLVRDALSAAGIPFVIVVPDPALKQEYLDRYRERGSPEAFIKLLDANWYNWLGECEDYEGSCAGRVVLGKGKYIANAVDELKNMGVFPPTWSL